MAVYERRDTRVAVTDYLGVYRCTPHATTGVTPAVLLHGRLLRTRLDIVGLPDSSFHENPAQMAVSVCQTKTSFFQTLHRLPSQSPDKTLCRRRLHPRQKVVSSRENILALFGTKKITEQRGPASFLLEDGRVWNASKFQAIHREAAEKLTSSRPGTLDWTLPLSDMPFQGSAPASDQHADFSPTSRQDIAAQANSASSSEPSPLQKKMTASQRGRADV